jgi:hypothetical protein
MNIIDYLNNKMKNNLIKNTNGYIIINLIN